MYKVANASACVPWPGCRTAAGYGRLKTEYAHRFVWRLLHGAIPDGLCVCHRCDNPLCVNPSHLFLGSATEGQARKAAPARRGAFSGNSKLTDADVRSIRVRAVVGVQGSKKDPGNLRALADEYGITTTAIWAIVRRKTWRHV